MKTRILLSAAAVSVLALALISCSDDRRSPPVAAFPTTPKFLIAVDGSGAGTNVNVFPIDATTGVLGVAVSGSPFDLGLTSGMKLAVHPNGGFVYAADASDGSIRAWSVSETTGVPTQIASPVIPPPPTAKRSRSASFARLQTPEAPRQRGFFLGTSESTVSIFRILCEGLVCHSSTGTH